MSSTENFDHLYIEEKCPCCKEYIDAFDPNYAPIIWNMVVKCMAKHL
jgi:hypothetical protein